MQTQLAKRYGDLFKVFAKYPQITRITFWGTHDGTSWLNGYPTVGRTNHPLPWDRQMKPKPAFEKITEVLATWR